LWLRGGCANGYQDWERISTVARAEITVEQGLCAAPATAIQARQCIRGFFGKLWPRFRRAPGDRTWLLPSGEPVEQQGVRQTELLLVWSADENTPLDEARLKARWPGGTRFQQLGMNLFLVGVESQDTGIDLPQGPPLQIAEHLLAAARAGGDRRREAAVLTDLGILLLREGDAQRAVALLEEALAIARQLGDRTREGDVLDNLGLAVLAAGQPTRALELLEQGLAHARAAGDPFA